MIPFARMLEYGNEVIPPSSDFLMTAEGGMKDLANPSRVISQVGTVITTTARALPGLTKSFDFRYAGANRYIVLNVADMPDLNVSKPIGNYTIEYFAYIDSVGGDFWYLSCGTGTQGTLKIYQGNFYLQNSTGGGTFVNVSFIPTGKWIHVALVQTETNIFLYLDGVRRMSAAGRWNVPNTPLRIGSYEVLSNSTIDQIRITNEALYTDPNIVPPAYPFQP